MAYLIIITLAYCFLGKLDAYIFFQYIVILPAYHICLYDAFGKIYLITYSWPFIDRTSLNHVCSNVVQPLGVHQIDITTSDDHGKDDVHNVLIDNFR